MIKRKAEPKQTEIGKQYVITHSQLSRYKTLNLLSKAMQCKTKNDFSL